jgi:tetratricopeptide (TPR) repeat protein
MNTTLLRAALAAVLLPLSLSAATPREELKTLTSQLQKAPGDDALRAKLIALAVTLKPAIPEEAREPFVMGATVLKKAEGTGSAAKAVDLFTKAIGVAPWYADAYYNRALAREAAGQYAEAMADLKLYLKFKLSANDRRQAQDKVYALKANAELAAEKKGEQDKVNSAAADAARIVQVKRDVITQIKNAVANRRYNSAMLSHDRNSGFGGVNENELYGGGTMFLFGNYDNYIYFWKFTDDRAEIKVVANNGYESCAAHGEPGGPSIADMRWFNGCGSEAQEQLWGKFDLRTAQLFTSVPGGSNRPIGDAGFDSSRRYTYSRYSPQ